MVNQVVIIAGGKGERLKKTIGSIPKALAPINGRTILDYQLENIRQYSFESIHFCLGEGSKEILEHLNTNYGQLNFTYRTEEEPLGTFGALKFSEEYLKEDFFVLLGDVITDINIDFFYKKFKKYDSDVHLISRNTDHPDDSDILVESKESNVERLDSSENLEFPYKPVGNTGLFFSKKSIIENSDLHRGDFFKNFLSNDRFGTLKVTSSKSIAFIKDFGTKDRYSAGIKQLKNIDKKKKILAIFDRDGTVTENYGDNLEFEFKLKNEFLDLALYLQSKNIPKILITNQPGIAKGFFSFDDLDKFHNLLQHKLINSGIKPFDEIYVCPHHPESGHDGEVKKLKKICDCRKPENGLVEKAKNEFYLNNYDFIFIGDSKNDYELSLKYNAKFYLVESEMTQIDFFTKSKIKIFDSLKNIQEQIDLDFY